MQAENRPAHTEPLLSELPRIERSKSRRGDARQLCAAAIIYDADGAYCLFGFGDAFGLGCVLVLASADRN